MGAAIVSLAEGLQAEEDGLDLDLPPATFSILSAMGEDRVYYRVNIGAEAVTGYADLPLRATLPDGAVPQFCDAAYSDTSLRLAAVTRKLLVDAKQVQALFVLGQTRFGQEAIADSIAGRAALLGICFFRSGRTNQTTVRRRHSWPDRPGCRSSGPAWVGRSRKARAPPDNCCNTHWSCTGRAG